MTVQVDIKKCTGCGSCVDVCPTEAIALVSEKAEVNEELCIDCGGCVDECNVAAISLGVGTVTSCEAASPSPAMASRPLSDPLSQDSRIKSVHLLVESPALALAGGVAITLPRTLFPSVDEELARSGYTSAGELLSFIALNRYNGPSIEANVGEEGVRAYAQRHFGTSEWACCGRRSELAHYHVLVAFR